MAKTIKIDYKDLPKTQSDTPVLDYCRQLITEGKPYETALEVYRPSNLGIGDILALRVKNIGLGARMSVRDNGLGTPVFRMASKVSASPVGALKWKGGRCMKVRAQNQPTGL